MRTIALAALAAMCAHSQTMTWDAQENTWACYSTSIVREQVIESWTAPCKVRIDVSCELANKRCVNIATGTILHSYEGGGAGSLSVILNQPYYDHFYERRRMTTS